MNNTKSSTVRSKGIPNQLTDDFSRQLTYLRLSITDFCNFSCDYCLPNGYGKPKRQDELSLTEIQTLVTAFASMGTQKVRLTGGEPSVRKDLPAIIEAVAQTSGIKQVCLSSNGHRLGKLYHAWLDAGLTQLNVSMDTFDPKAFSDITGHNMLPQLLMDMDAFINDGRASLKINAVLKAQHAQETLDRALDYVRYRPVSFRFIEFMQTTHNANLFFREHISAEQIIKQLVTAGWQLMPRSVTSGPAMTYAHPDYLGSIGVIAPYTSNFCDTCNRVRVTAQGKLHMCLFDAINYDLRPFINLPCPNLLQQKLQHLIHKKPEHHHLHEGDSGLMHNLSLVGG